MAKAYSAQKAAMKKPAQAQIAILYLMSPFLLNPAMDVNIALASSALSL